MEFLLQFPTKKVLLGSEDDREAYFSFVSNELSAVCTLPWPEDNRATKVYECDGYYAIVTYGIGCEREFVVRFFAADDAQAMALAAQLDRMCALFGMMQDNCVFNCNESADISIALPWEIPTGRPQGALILQDPVLVREGTVFLQVLPLRSADYAYLQAVRLVEFAAILKEHDPLLLLRLDSNDWIHHPALRQRFQTLFDSSPAQIAINGVTLDLRLRKSGAALDMLTSGRNLHSICAPLNNVFGKQPVPVGSVVRLECDGGQCEACFSCHDDDGNEITPETAFFKVTGLHYADGESNPRELAEALQFDYALMPQGELWTKKRLIRRMYVDIHMPAAMLAGMLDDVRNGVSADGSNWDPDSKPMVLSWPQHFVGTNGKSGFMDRPCSTAPATFRFICAGLTYFEDQVLINDDGDFVDAKKPKAKATKTNSKAKKIAQDFKF